MINPAFEDGSIAEEGTGSDERGESGDSVGESGSGSGSSDEIGSSDDQSDESDESESKDGESSSGMTDSTATTDEPDTTDTTDAPDTSSSDEGESTETETGSMACMGLVGENECESCKIDACCHDTNYECFDPNAEDCDCVIDCLSIGGLLNLCGLQCGVLELLQSVAETTFDCILQECDQVCQ